MKSPIGGMTSESGTRLVELAVRGLLLESIGPYLGDAVNMIDGFILPYCRWPVGIKRMRLDDFGEWDVVVHDGGRDELPTWHLFGRGCYLANFRGFVSKLEICTHLGQALIQPKIQPLDPKPKPSWLNAADVAAAMGVLVHIMPTNQVEERYGNDYVRYLLDRFDDEDTDNKNVLVPDCVLEHANRFFTKTQSPFRELALPAVLQRSRPYVSITHPDLAPLPPPLKRRKKH